MNLFIDIETLPGDKMPDVSEVKVPANYKDPAKIEEYQKVHLDEEYRKQALDSMKGRIICVGYAIDDSMVTVFAGEEKEVLIELASALFTSYHEPFQWVGWNIETFDIPWLWRRAIKHCVLDLRNIIPKGNKKMIIDLMRVWGADYKDYTKMSDCSDFLGITHSEIKGSDVYDFYKAGDIAAIEKHCREDVQTTRAIYERIFT